MQEEVSRRRGESEMLAKAARRELQERFERHPASDEDRELPSTEAMSPKTRAGNNNHVQTPGTDATPNREKGLLAGAKVV